MWPVLNYTVLMLFCLKYRKHYALTAAKAIGSLAIVFVTGFAWMLLIGWAQTGFTRFGDNNIVKGYCFFAVFALIPAKLFKIDKKKEKAPDTKAAGRDCETKRPLPVLFCTNLRIDKTV